MLQIKRLELFCEMRQIAAEHLQRTAAVPGFQRNFVEGESGKKGWSKALVDWWYMLSFSLSKAAREAYRRTGATRTRLCRELVMAASLSQESRGGFGPWEGA